MDDVNQSTAGVEPEPESEPNLELEPEAVPTDDDAPVLLSLIHISQPPRLLSISYAVFCLTKNN